MMSHISTSAPINVFELDECTATTSTRIHLRSDGPVVKFHMERAATCEAVRYIKPKIREL
jgi:hypothetical protein